MTRRVGIIYRLSQFELAALQMARGRGNKNQIRVVRWRAIKGKANLKRFDLCSKRLINDELWMSNLSVRRSSRVFGTLLWSLVGPSAPRSGGAIVHGPTN